MKKLTAISQALRILKQFPQVKAAGLSGSRCRNESDKYSDYDICIYSNGIPNPESRRKIYSGFGIDHLQFFDEDFEVSRCDGLRIGKEDVGFVWMDWGKTKSFIKNLGRDYYCDEFLPGGLAEMKSLMDGTGALADLKRMLPEYPRMRAIRRIERNIGCAYFTLYTLAWLQKASFRRDHYSFMKYKGELIDYFVTTLFALNKRWYSDEKRLLRKMEAMQLAPSNVDRRLKSIIMHTGGNRQLGTCLINIKKLFGELVAIANAQYPEIELPEGWK